MLISSLSKILSDVFSPTVSTYIFLGIIFLKLFEKPHGLLISFSRSAERTTFRSGPQKEALSKVCRKFDTFCTPHSAERTIFSRYDAKNRSVPQKERMLARFSKLSFKGIRTSFGADFPSTEKNEKGEKSEKNKNRQI